MNAEISDFRFPQDSAMASVNGWRGTTLGGQRALHLQIAHPLVAQALDDTNFLRVDPYKRLLGTLNAGLDLTFSTPAEAAAIAGWINGMHKNVHGSLKVDTGIYKKGTAYDAMDQNLLKWVGATLIDGSICGYELFVGDLTNEQKDEYLDNASDLFTLVHLERTALPTRFEGLQEYIQDMIDTREVEVGDLARNLAPYLTLSRASSFPKIATDRLRSLAAYTLPDKIRDQFGYDLPNWEKLLIERLAAITRNGVVQKVLPDIVKYWKQARETKRLLKAS